MRRWASAWARSRRRRSSARRPPTSPRSRGRSAAAPSRSSRVASGASRATTQAASSSSAAGSGFARRALRRRRSRPGAGRRAARSGWPAPPAGRRPRRRCRGSGPGCGRCRRSISRSVSHSSQPRRSASRRPRVVLPLPGRPTRAIGRGRPWRPVTGAAWCCAGSRRGCGASRRAKSPPSFSAMAAAIDPAEHRLGDHRTGRDHADVAPLVVGVDLVAGARVDRAQRREQGRDRLEVDGGPDRLAVGDPAGQPALAVGEVAKPLARDVAGRVVDLRSPASGRRAAAAPISTPLTEGMLQRAWAIRPSSLRSHCA